MIQGRLEFINQPFRSMKQMMLVKLSKN